MESLLVENLIKKVEEYDNSARDNIYKVFDYACKVHGNQRRKSGELYIIHPLQVALILAEQYADIDTVCAGLLHDVLEDGDGITPKDLEQEFNKMIAVLTNGVTKIPLRYFSTKQEQNNANFRKLIMGIAVDPRIILIKLADRLHNMRTLMYLPRNKQIENSIETLDFFVPLANYYGFQQMKNELEELSFQYLNNDIYQSIQEQRLLIMEQDDILRNISTMIHDDLNKNKINNKVDYRFKRPYAIYQQLTKKSISPTKLLELKKKDLPQIKESQIHDIRSLKILVSQLQDCYSSQELLIRHYTVMTGKQKDCIKNPKTNGYQSLHTTIYGNERTPIQTQIRTYAMDEFDKLGLVSYWKEYGKEAYLKMHEDLVEKCSFYQTLEELNTTFSKNEDFVKHVKGEVLTNMIYPKTIEGETIELPLGATPVDFALKTNHNIVPNAIIALVNGKEVSLNTPLPNKAVVEIIPTLEQYVVGSLSSYAVTTYAKQRIKRLRN